MSAATTERPDFLSRLDRQRVAVDFRDGLLHYARKEFLSSPQLTLIENLLGAGNPSVNIGQALDYMDALFAESISFFTSGYPCSAPSELDSKLRESASKLATDGLADKVMEWSALRATHFEMLRRIEPTKSAALVTSIRNEGIGILEWIAHHRSLGFNRIFIYANNNTDDSDELLSILDREGVIRLIRNAVNSSGSPQVKAYEHSLNLLPELRDHLWVMYLDADEFFVPRCGPDYDLQSMLAKVADSGEGVIPDSIAFNWKWFGSENAYKRSDGLLLNRFQYSIHNEHVKCITKLACIKSMKLIHAPEMIAGAVAVDSNLTPVPVHAVKVEPTYGYGQINHYWNKSFEEFVIKKFRGRGAVGTSGPQRDFSTFFDWGSNANRGNFDPPHPTVVSRDSKSLADLRELPGVPEAESRIYRRFLETLTEIDKEWDLEAIYKNRGRTQ